MQRQEATAKRVGPEIFPDSVKKEWAVLRCSACDLGLQKHANVPSKSPAELRDLRDREDPDTFELCQDAFGPVAVPSFEGCTYAELYILPKTGMWWIFPSKHLTEEESEGRLQTLRNDMRLQMRKEVSFYKTDGLRAQNSKAMLEFLTDALIGKRTTPPCKQMYNPAERVVGVAVFHAATGMLQANAPPAAW